MTTNDADERNTRSSNLNDLADVVAMVNDEEERARKGKAKIVCDEKVDEESVKKLEKRGFFDHVPMKIRSALRYPQPNFENPYGASTSSSSLPSSSSLNPPNPNPPLCSTESTNPKMRWAPQRWSCGGFKKAKVASFPRMERCMPRWLVQVMRDMNAQYPTLIFEKTLYAADVNPNQSRFAMPFNRLIRNDFLTPLEWRIVGEEDMDDNDNKIGVGAILVDPRSEKWGVILKRWGRWDYAGNRSWNYALNCGWNDIVEANKLKVGDNISVWSFRCRGILCFAIVPLIMRQSSSSLSL